MDDIGDWLDRCKGDAETFDTENPLGFCLYSVVHGPLIPVDVSAGATLSRQLLPAGGKGAAARKETMFKVFKLGGPAEVVIGSSEECGVVINDESISARHAVLTRDGDQVRIRDLGSTLGTQVVGESLEGDEQKALESGAKLTLGSVELQYLSSARFRLFVTGLLSE